MSQRSLRVPSVYTQGHLLALRVVHSILCREKGRLEKSMPVTISCFYIEIAVYTFVCKFFFV